MNGQKALASAPIVALFLTCSALQDPDHQPVGLHRPMTAAMTQAISGSGYLLLFGIVRGSPWWLVYRMSMRRLASPARAAINMCFFIGDSPSSSIWIDGIALLLFPNNGFLVHWSAALFLGFMLITNFLCCGIRYSRSIDPIERFYIHCLAYSVTRVDSVLPVYENLLLFSTF